MDDDLVRRLELLKQAMAEPLTAPEPKARDPDEFFKWLLKKQGEYRRRNKCEHGLNRHECGICS